MVFNRSWRAMDILILSSSRSLKRENSQNCGRGSCNGQNNFSEPISPPKPRINQDSWQSSRFLSASQPNLIISRPADNPKSWGTLYIFEPPPSRYPFEIRISIDIFATRRKFGAQCVGRELASCITNHICSWSCCCCCGSRIRLQYSLSRGDECRTFHLLKQVVQSTYNSAKRRMVSVRKLPVGVRRRFEMSPISQGRSRQRRFSWHFRIPEQLTQSSSPIASTLLPEGMQGVEHNTLSNISPIPASSNAVAWEATILPSIDGSASYSRKVNGAFLHKISPPPSKFVSSPNELLSNLDAPQRAKSHGHQSKLSPTGSSDIKGGVLPHVTIYRSARTGLSLNRTKKFVKDEAMDYFVDCSTLKVSPMFEPVENPTRKGQDAKGSKTGPPIRDELESARAYNSPDHFQDSWSSEATASER